MFERGGVHLGSHEGDGRIRQGKLYQHRVHGEKTWRREGSAVPFTSGVLHVRGPGQQAGSLWLLSDKGL